MDKPSNSGHLLLWGVLSGVILGMLFAPKKGSILRSQLGRAGTDGVSAQANLIKDELAKVLQDMLHSVHKLRENKAVHKLLGEIGDHANSEDQSI